MQCGCLECGYLMGQVVKGLESYCQCPACEQKCRACLGREDGYSAFISQGSLLQKKGDLKTSNIIDGNIGRKKV